MGSKRTSGSRRAPAPSSSARTAKAKAPARTAALQAYEARRDFALTPEPAPGSSQPAATPRFVVHKHDANRLHYDFRLEMGGALASWAVPKGPSFDPKARRLAVETEDHPLEYGDFEGRIPDGEYGAGDSLLWDRGSWQTVPPGEAEEQRKKGHIRFELEGEKLRGQWHLVRTRRAESGKEQWLFFKAKDDFAIADRDILAERPESVVSGRVVTRGPERKSALQQRRPEPEALLEAFFPPMLAQPADAAPTPDGAWLYELKYDGFRALCALANGRVAIWSRNGLDLAGRFPHLASALARIVVGDAVLDGEIAVLDPHGAPRFELLQKGHDEQAVFFGFDLLRLDGEDLRKRKLEERRDLLVSVLANVPASLRLAEIVEGSGAAALEEAARRGFEGIIAKRRGSPWEKGRSPCWKKVKVLGSQEVAVVGFTRTSTGADAIGALLVAVYEEGGFVFAGKVGTGFTAKQRGELYRALAPLAAKKPTVRGAPRTRGHIWVEPQLVAQVRFTEWTADGKLRHPSFQGLRDDKRPEECRRETLVRPITPSPTAARQTAAHQMTAREAPARQPVEVKLTTPDRLLWPRDGIRKRDLAAYFEQVAGPMLRALEARPLALEHWPKGIDEPSWFHQNIGKEAAAWMTLVETPTRTSGRMVRHLVADRPEALRWLAQHSVITSHMWSSREGHLEQPDWVVFDLDPAPKRGMDQVAEAARALHSLLEALSLPSVPKTSGKRGLHVLVPLVPGHTHEDAIAFALHVGRAVAEVLPSVTLERSLSQRQGRLYLDCLQNGYGKTIVAPYSPRGVDGAPVSAPLRWSEVDERLEPRDINLRTMPGRIAAQGDLFLPALEQGVRLPRFR